MSEVSISIIVPVYSGSQYLERLINEIERLKVRWEQQNAPMRLAEVILVNDEAIDASPAIIDRLAADKGWVTAIHLSRNFGQHAATIAGILHSSGDWVVTVDEDLQHPPSQIDALIRQAAKNNGDIVYARPESTVHERSSRDVTSRVYKHIIAFVSGNKNAPDFSSFRLIRGSIARAASSICGHDTYFDVALSWFTQRVHVAWMVLKDERVISGQRSGYKFSSLVSHARRMLMSGQIKLIRTFGLFGLAVALFSVFSGLILLAIRLLVPGMINIAGWTSLSLMLLFFGGITTLLLGLALEYLSILTLASNGKPRFFVVDRHSDAALIAYFNGGESVNFNSGK